ASQLWQQLGLEGGGAPREGAGFRTDVDGRLVFPPPYDPVPAPAPLNLQELTAAQAELWLKLQRGSVDAREAEILIGAAREFIASSPPENFVAAAEYKLGLLLRPQQPVEAAHVFEALAQKYPDAIGESGLPLRPMAQFQSLETGPSGEPGMSLE